MTRTVPAIQTYKEALSELVTAVNALDQAHSMLKDIDLHNCISTKCWGRWVSLKEAVDIADGLLREAQKLTCEECGKPMAENEDCLEGNCNG